MKKKVSLLLAILLAVTPVLLSSCGKGETPKETKAPSESGNPAETEKKDPLEGLYYDGQEFRIQSSIDTSDSTNADRLIRGSGEIMGEAVNDAVYNRNASACDKLGITLSFTLSSFRYRDVETKVSAMILANVDPFDVTINDNKAFAALAANGYFRNVADNGIWDLDQSYWYAEAMEDCSFVEGGTYLLFGDYFTDILNSTHALYVNEDMLTDYYNDPDYIKNLVFDGNWTYDTMTEIVNHCVKDLNGDGQITEGDQYGFMCIGTHGSLIPFITAADIKYMDRADGKITFAFNNERSVKLLEKLNVLFYAKGSRTTLEDYSDAGLRKMFTDQKTLLMGYNRLGDIDKLRDVEMHVGMVPYPKLDESQENYVSSLHDTTEIGAIPVTVGDKKIEFVYACLEILGRETATLVIPTWYETALKIKYADDPKDAKMIDLIHDSIDKPFVVTYNAILDGFMIGCFGGPLDENSTNFASYYKAHEKSADASAKTVYEKFEKNLADGN